jgi:hypothetical protein
LDQLFVYVSSHADGGDLHLDGSRLSVSELNTFVQQAPVGVGFFILDSCRSGSATRLKGLEPKQGVSIQLEAGDIRGRVVISASGPDEYAQESDELQGSYFTHHLIAALRGAADSSKDGRVTLQEAYVYAYARTLESTFGTRGGLQRPSYHVDLRGRGELILSELQLGKGRLVLDVVPSGQWQIISTDGSAVIAQLEKAAGPIEISLPPGRYRAKTRIEDRELEKHFAVIAGKRAVIQLSDLDWSAAHRGTLKGGRRRLIASLGGSGASSAVAGPGILFGAEGRLHLDGVDGPGPVNVVSLSLSYRWGRGRRLVRFTQRELELRAGLGHTVDWGRLSVGAGPEVGAILVRQGNLPDGSSRVGLEPSLGLSVDGRLRLRRGLGLFLSFGGSAVLVRKDSGVRPEPRATTVAGVSVEL